MKIEFQTDNRASVALRDLVRDRLPRRRTTFVEQALRNALQGVIRSNPVDTARSRAAWVQSLEQLGGTPPAGWEGPSPRKVAEGRRRGELHRRSGGDLSEVAATNGVDYVPFLEYGTRRQSPVGMVRRALLALKSRGNWWLGLFSDR